jgi:hypothetical protein
MELDVEFVVLFPCHIEAVLQFADILFMQTDGVLCLFESACLLYLVFLEHSDGEHQFFDRELLLGFLLFH